MTTAAASSSAANGETRAMKAQLTAKEKKKVEKLIRNTKSLSEIARLEKELAEGRIPAGVMDDDEDEEMT